jgi:hypothetical protein
MAARPKAGKPALVTRTRERRWDVNAETDLRTGLMAPSEPSIRIYEFNVGYEVRRLRKSY